MIHIERKEDCCGCTACKSVCRIRAIHLEPDEEGYLYPQFDLEKCIDCHLCEKVCPVLFRKQSSIQKAPLSIYATRQKDQIILKESSSGGIFTALAQYVLNKNGVVVGATYDEKMVVHHIIVNNINNLQKLRGSKYVQSDIQGIFQVLKKHLDEGVLVLFSGTPCQVEGLYLFLRKKYTNLITIDIVCHAVGSPKLFKEYIEYLENKLKNRVTWINMRDKDNYGWGHRFSQRVWTENGKSYSEKNGIFPWWTIYYSNMANRPSCHECKFTNFSRPGDFSIADFWDDKHQRSDIYSNKGTSLCLINSVVGLKIFDVIKDNIYYWEVTKEQAWQPCLEFPTPRSSKRLQFWGYYHKNGLEQSYRHFLYIPKATRLKWKIKDTIAKWIGYGKKN